MTDGPFKSLPMKRPWKRVAEMAWNCAYSQEQVSEVVPHALLAECDRVLLRRVAAALSPTEQGVLFEETAQAKAQRVHAVRLDCPGSQFGGHLIDAAIFELYHSPLPAQVLSRAVESALRETAASAYRGIEEHGIRSRGTETVTELRDRLMAANINVDYRQLSESLLSGSNDLLEMRKVPKRFGIDEGAEL